MDSSIPIILLAFANDTESPLRELAEEQDELIQALHSVHDAGVCQVFTIAAASPEKIISVFQRYGSRIRIFHYGGHSDQEALFLQQDFPGQENTRAAYLAGFLGAQEDLELVFINGCLSSAQAAVYHREGIPAVIATDHTVGDAAAREFARYFYQTLAGGSTISEAFRSAATAYKTKHNGSPRGQGFLGEGNDAPWKLSPEGSHSWRLPAAKPDTETLKLRFITHRRPTRQDRLLQRLLVLSDLQAALQEHQVLWLHGPSGCGKTVLAEQYYHLFLSQYQHVAWIEVKHDFLQDFIAAAPLAVPIPELRARLEDLDRPRPDIDRACARAFSQYLANLPGRVLLVVDGIKDLQQFTPYYDLLELHQNHVLITSLEIPAPDHPWSRRYHCHAFTAPPFTNEEIHLLAASYAREYPHAPELLDHLRHNVYLSSILFKNLNRQQPARLDEQLRTLLEQAPAASVDESLLTLLFQQFQPTPAAGWVLLQWAALPEGFYEPEMVADLIGIEEMKQPIATEGYRNFKGKDKGFLLWRKRKNNQFLEALQQLRERGWLVGNEEGQLSLHARLVPVLQAELTPRLDFFVELSENLQEVFFLDEEIGVEGSETGDLDKGSWMRSNIQYENHLRSLVDLIQKETSEGFLSILTKFISVLEANLKLIEELRVQKQFVSILKNWREVDSGTLSAALNNLGRCFNRNGLYEEGLRAEIEAQAILKSEKEVNNLSLAICYNNMAIAYQNLGDYEKSLDHLQKSLLYLELILGPNHPDLAFPYNNIAITYRLLGEYKQALTYNQRSLAIRESALQWNHPKLANSYSSIAETYNNLGKYRNALFYHQKAQMIRESVLDVEHPDLATSYNGLAVTYRYLGRNDKAIFYNQKALAIWESAFDLKHPILATCYDSIACTYRYLAQYDKAILFHQKAQAIWGSKLDANHPYIATCYNNMAGTFRDHRQYESALQYYFKAQELLKLVLNENHPDFATTYYGIGKTFYALNDFESALRYHHKALVIRELKLDSNHPYLAKSYQNIATTYHALGQTDQANHYEAKAAAIITQEEE
ncbi:tetratricopeptide repeat protein [Flavilitoribacter nigricans]|uniref:Uncharacterized protein n=1 Tax=Flavilitoribacter nigricans (strain ATCC 23147 / DSM 23189 / NBRC 102662 / NCIMB 1420 / SS-2) TaxID=1122177 RepID=A0A2D0NH58_FLAN2|nr:tetratricopeptide repeat protein [Flavilitoribacter nigricans]PHN07817.1 hypothetical protein CRP01_04660 [Flavilitoribacter nigricans DSM 23189 = NBRC 102662]